jgi:predicted ABC-type transport system involved in lysophospholipase L1 biosynthesis ATPase subunit
LHHNDDQNFLILLGSSYKASLDRNAARRLAGADYALPYQMGKTMEKTIHDWQLPEECRKVIFYDDHFIYNN